MIPPTSEKLQLTYYSVIQQYKSLIEEVKQNPNKSDYLSNPKILGLSISDIKDAEINEIAFEGYPEELVYHMDTLIEAQATKLLQTFDFVMFVAPTYPPIHNDGITLQTTQLKISLINRYIPELNITTCYLEFDEDPYNSENEPDIETRINFPNCYDNKFQSNYLSQYQFDKIEVNQYTFLLQQKWFPTIFSKRFTITLALIVFWCFISLLLFSVLLIVGDLLKRFNVPFHSFTLSFLITIPPFAIYYYLEWKFANFLKISNNKLSVRTGILKYTTIPLDNILNIQVLSDNPARNQDSYNLKLTYLDQSAKSIKSAVINPQWTRFNTAYILTGLNAACFNYDKDYQ